MARLHNLYEQVAPSREHFVYYCASCRCVSGIRQGFESAYKSTDKAPIQCLGCGGPLEDSVGCRPTLTLKNWTDVLLETTPETEEPTFRTASSFPHFSLGFPKIDSLLRPLSEGRLIVLRGEPSSALAELAAFRAQLPVEAGGLDSPAFFVDGGNKSDPYLFSSFAKQKQLKPVVAMRRVTTCRVFTFYQLAGLVSEHLARAVEDYGVKLVVISDILGTFNEPELDEREARRVLGGIEEGMVRAKDDALVLVTLSTPNKHDGLVAEWADVMVEMSSSGGRVRADLVKHPSRPPTSTSFKFGQLLRSAKTGARR
jgi:hypothetical protein